MQKCVKKPKYCLVSFKTVKYMELKVSLKKGSYYSSHGVL
jgi:hypothetical protein